MNIIEAAKTGLPMRRKGWNNWYKNAGCIAYKVEDIPADDWEVDEPKVTITRRKLNRAFNKTQSEGHGWFELFAEELGL